MKMPIMKMTTFGAALAALVAAGGLALAAGKTIQVKGSDTMVNLGTAWAEEFMKRKPGAEIAVTGGGSGTGIAALINGTCDVAECSRAMKPKEKEQVKAKGAEAKEFTVAIDALVVAVNPANKVEKLTFDQLSDIFQGKKTSWKDFGGEDRPITVLSRERNSGTHVYFLEHVVRHGNDKGPEEYAKTALMMASSQAIVDEIATNKDAIGYYGLGYLSEKNRPLAVAQKDGGEFVKPSAADATAGRYPISRPLFLYTRGEPQGEVKEFIDFCLSGDGQRVVEKLDFVRLPAKQ
jgi:phosphate transport system substrate-binding protein